MNRSSFWAGVRAEFPLLVGVFPFGLIYGVLAIDAGLSISQAQSMSWIVFAGSSQFLASQLVHAAVPGMVIVLTIAIVNLRHLLYSASLAPYLRKLSSGWKLLLAYLLTDEPGYPNFSTTWIEMVGTEGALLVDDSHRDVVLNTMDKGMQLPMSTMPGERVEHTYAGPMAAETIHFLEAVALDRPVMVTPEHARMVMEVYIAADISAEKNEPVSLPLKPAKSVRAAA